MRYETYKDNFMTEDVKYYNFSQGPFDFIITNPFYTGNKILLQPLFKTVYLSLFAFVILM